MSEIEAGSDRERLLRELGTKPGIEVSMTVGIEHFRTGLITLTVASDGRVQVLQRRAGKETPYSASWDRARVEAFGAELATHRFCQLAARSETREPDDVPVKLMLSLAGDRVCAADLWHGDRYEDKDLDALLTRFDAVVTEVTAGALPYGRPKP